MNPPPPSLQLPPTTHPTHPQTPFFSFPSSSTLLRATAGTCSFIALNYPLTLLYERHIATPTLDYLIPLETLAEILNNLSCHITTSPQIDITCQYKHTLVNSFYIALTFLPLLLTNIALAALIFKLSFSKETYS